MKPSSKLGLANFARFKARDWQDLDVRRAMNVDVFTHLMSCPQQRGRQESHISFMRSNELHQEPFTATLLLWLITMK